MLVLFIMTTQSGKVKFKWRKTTVSGYDGDYEQYTSDWSYQEMVGKLPDYPTPSLIVTFWMEFLRGERYELIILEVS